MGGILSGNEDQGGEEQSRQREEFTSKNTRHESIWHIRNLRESRAAELYALRWEMRLKALLGAARS